MRHEVAEIIGIKSRALKHCNKILKEIDEKGSADIKIGATGVMLPCVKNDSLHTLIQSVKYKLAYELGSLDVSIKSEIKAVMTPLVADAKRVAVAPVGACDSAVCVVCGKEITGKRRKVCSDTCAKEHLKVYKHEYYMAHKSK